MGRGAQAASAARRYGVLLLGQIPLSRAIREGGDADQPIVIADAHSPQGEAFRATAQIAERLNLEAMLTGGKRPSGPLIEITRKGGRVAGGANTCNKVRERRGPSPARAADCVLG